MVLPYERGHRHVKLVLAQTRQLDLNSSNLEGITCRFRSIGNAEAQGIE